MIWWTGLAQVGDVIMAVYGNSVTRATRANQGKRLAEIAVS